MQLSAGHYAPLDAQGIPVRRGLDGRSFVHNYTRICAFALASWNIYLRTRDSAHLSAVLHVADYILATAKRTRDAVYLQEEKPGKGHTGPISSMSQGQGMSVLCRAWQATLQEQYLEAAIASLHPFTIVARRGGVLSAIRMLGVPWFEEYPREENHVLNGMVFAVWGLGDLAVSTSCQLVKDLFDTGVNSIACALPLFDNTFWSWYSVQMLAMPTYQA